MSRSSCAGPAQILRRFLISSRGRVQAAGHGFVCSESTGIILVTTECHSAPVPPDRWARLVEVTDNVEWEWDQDELRDVLVHQLSAPVEFELEGVRSGGSPATSPAELAAVHSFEELFQLASPPLELLRLTKDYAKAHLLHPDRTLAKEVATVLYYASTALALTCHNSRISTASDKVLCQNFQWCASQPWMDPALQKLFQKAMVRLSSCPAEAAGL